jgi:hypothetical protein
LKADNPKQDFSLLGDLTELYVKRWQKNPVGWLCNALGVAYARFAFAWSRGTTQLASPDPRFPPFWHEFQASYYYDSDCAEKLQGRYPEHHTWDGAWYPNNNSELEIWKILAPYIQSTLFPLIEKFSDEKFKPNCPVLHYRAGDVPFDRSVFYRFARYDFYDWCMEQVPERRWLIVTDLKAMMATPAQVAASSRYLDDLRLYLDSKGIETFIMEQRSPFDDLYTMIHAPYLMASIFTSFAYFAGLAKPEGNYVVAHSPKTRVDVPWMCKAPSLPHEEVADYLDTAAVLRQLRGEYQ